MDILIVIEDNNTKVHRRGLECITAAKQIAKETALSIDPLVMGSNADDLASQVTNYEINEVLTLKHELLSSYSCDGYAEAVKQVIEQESPKYVLFGHTYQVRDYVPKISAKLMKPFIVDSISMKSDGEQSVFTKQMFNAKLYSDMIAMDEGPLLISFQSAAYSSDKAIPGSASVRELSVNIESSMIKTQSEEPFQEESGGVDLTSAEIIVSVGRGIGKEENISMAEDLAKIIGGELASSRPVVDSGWLSATHQIGSSGQSVSPKMYLALGISGAIQHVVGMKGSKNIVAINKDPEAPIFEIADYGVVADVLEILPKLTEALK